MLFRRSREGDEVQPGISYRTGPFGLIVELNWRNRHGLRFKLYRAFPYRLTLTGYTHVECACPWCNDFSGGGYWKRWRSTETHKKRN